MQTEDDDGVGFDFDVAIETTITRYEEVKFVISKKSKRMDKQDHLRLISMDYNFRSIVENTS